MATSVRGSNFVSQVISRTFRGEWIVETHDGTGARSEGRPARGRFEHIPTLDGWRAIAILAVIAYHCQSNDQLKSTFLYHFASRGNTGVDMFFALSGFLICGKLLGEQSLTGTVSLKQFYLRRCFRILPPLLLYLSVLGLLAAAGWVQTRGWEFASTLFYVRNYFPLFDGHVWGRYTAHFWSLAVEEHFYFAWPLVMLLLGPKVRRIAIAALVLALAIFVWRTVDAHYGWLIPYGASVASKTDTRMDGLLWGCLAATVYPYFCSLLRSLPVTKEIWIPVGLALGAALVFRNTPWVSLAIAILFAAVILSTAIWPTSLLGRILELGVLRWLGRLSYSLYIWQQLFIFPTISSLSPLRFVQHFPGNLGLTLLFASGSYYAVERPLIQLGRSLAQRSRVTRRAQAIEFA